MLVPFIEQAAAAAVKELKLEGRIRRARARALARIAREWLEVRSFVRLSK
jgi:hypothetical protein